MKRKAISTLLAITLITAISITGCSSKTPQEVGNLEENYVPVEIQTVKKDTIANSIALNGKIYANEEVMVIPQMPGKVSEVRVKLGDYVDKDQVLFVMDQKEIQRAIEQAEQAIDLATRGVEQAENVVRTSKIQYESTKERMDDALVALERMKALYEAGAISKSQLEQAELAASTKPLEAAETQVKQAEVTYQQSLNQLEQARSAYEHVKSNLDNTLGKAPIAGIVNSLNVVEGELASSAQAAATIVDIDQVYLQVNVSENIVNKLHQGQEVSVKVPSALDEEIIGKIDYISPTVDQRTQLYLVKVHLLNEDHKIKPGMSGAMTLETESRQDVLAIKRSAIIEKEEETLVYLVRDERAIQQKVTLGLDTGSYVEVIEGLKEGDVVITKGQHYVTDGQRVKVVRGE